MTDLKCDDMTGNEAAPCTRPVSMIDKKGYVYCTPCGLDRRGSGVPCRKLETWERRRLERGEPLRRY